MKKKYTADEILQMAAGKLKAKYDADLDGSGSVDAADAELARQGDSRDGGVSVSENKLGRLFSLTSSADAGELYAKYRDRYADGARKAAENAFGIASSYTGGYGNTYASSAAAAAYEKYMSGLSGEVADAQDRAYKNAVSFADKAAGHGDYSYLEAMGADMSAARRNEALALAFKEAENGDYAGLEYMGVDTTLLRYNELLKFAGKMAEYGDYSGLEALGVDVSSLQNSEKLETALALAKYGDLSMLAKLSGGTGAIRSKISATIQKGAQTAYADGGYAGLVSYLNGQVGYGQITEADKKQIISVVTGV